MTILAEYQHIEIAIELDKGYSFEEVAKQFGVSTQMVRKLAVATGLRVTQTRKSSKKKKLFEEDTKRIVERIEAGDLLEEIALDFEVSVHAIRQLCQRKWGFIPRALHHLKRSEIQEIREFLAAEESLVEIARAYNLAYATVVELQEEEYKKLDFATLGFLYEAFMENPEATPPVLKRLAQKKGFALSENAILSYQNRLKKLRQLPE